MYSLVNCYSLLRFVLFLPTFTHRCPSPSLLIPITGVGGHNPLTYREQQQYAKGEAYGTVSQRLGKESQTNFGDCCLSLYPAVEAPVCTPAGYVYEKASILEYLLTKTQALQHDQAAYAAHLRQQDQAHTATLARQRTQQIVDFEQTQHGTRRNHPDTTSHRPTKKMKTGYPEAAAAAAVGNSLKTTSYWLADSMNDTALKDGSGGGGSEDTPAGIARQPPLKRPPSPNSQRPLRRKDLIDLDLTRMDTTTSGSSSRRSKDYDKVLCAISEKPISTQQAVALVTKGKNAAQVVLEKVWKELGKDARKICPVTGRKIQHIIPLQKGGSAFAALSSSASGNTADETTAPANTMQQQLVAKQYRPTIT